MTDTPQQTSHPVPPEERTWWKESVVYQIYPRSFADSDGDGIGDIPGIIDRLDHVADLGVDVIWLNPVYESPQRDNGYDISDYRSIHHEYGTMADWEELLAQVHERDMRLVMDLVVNHTSTDHEWFQRSRRGDPEYEDYYIWRDPKGDGPPNNWDSFFGGSAWTYDDERGEYYLHLYDESQPDLNWRNPAVRRDIFDTMEWWLEKDVDGFRMDVINLLSKAPGLPDGDPNAEWTGAEHFVDGPRILEYLEAMDEQVLSNYDVMTVGEMPRLTVETAREYAGEDGPLDMAFHFQHTKLDYDGDERWSVGDWDLPELKEITRRWHDGLDDEGWNALYWENHDQPRVVSRYGDPAISWAIARGTTPGRRCSGTTANTPASPTASRGSRSTPTTSRSTSPTPGRATQSGSTTGRSSTCAPSTMRSSTVPTTTSNRTTSDSPRTRRHSNTPMAASASGCSRCLTSRTQQRRWTSRRLSRTPTCYCRTTTGTRLEPPGTTSHTRPASTGWSSRRKSVPDRLVSQFEDSSLPTRMTCNSEYTGTPWSSSMPRLSASTTQATGLPPCCWMASTVSVIVFPLVMVSSTT